MEKSSRRARILRYLILVGTISAVVAAIAQTDQDSANRRIIIDGAQEPDRIPEWILWNEIFQRAASHDEKWQDQGEELWVERIHLTRDAMNEVIKHGYQNRDLHVTAKNKAKQIIAESKGGSNKDRVKVRLRKIHLYTESRTLELRDKLRVRIGEEAFLKLQSYAKLNIAPTVKVAY